MKYFISILVGVLLLAGFFYFRNQEQVPSHAISFEETTFDFGIIKQSGGVVSHEFWFEYLGSQTLTVTGLPTSCGCTSAQISPSVLTPGATGVVTVKFNPNLHAEPEGRFYKTISFLTNPETTDLPELKIFAEIDLDLGSESYEQEIHQGEVILASENLSPEKYYQTITAQTLKDALVDKHFYLVDVHTPEQAHIEGTDAVIPFDQIAGRVGELLSDKDDPIVLYCRSGSMSQQAAQTLFDLGYTNVIHVQGGAQAFNEIQ